MERIKRALELAAAEREQALGQAAAATFADSRPTADTTAAESAARTRSQPVNLNAMREGGLLLPGMVGTVAHSFKMLRTQVMQRMRPRG